MNMSANVHRVLATLAIILGLFLLNGGVVIFGLVVLATGVYFAYKTLPGKSSN